MSRKLVALLTLLGVALALAGAAAANLSVGVNDDASKDPALASWFFTTMQSEGLKINTLTVLWDETSPTVIPDADKLDATIARAKASGVTVELDLYPLHSMALTGGARCAANPDPESCGDTSRIQEFAAWTASVARRFPNVTQFVVMNECNQPRFVNPQWDQSGANQSAEVCGRALVAAYDALKAVSSTNFVWGVGLSPRGNDSPNAASNSSTKPVTFLGALGSWFHAYMQKTHRTKGLMDGFDFHPYPVPQTQPFAQGYADPKEASITNLSRIYQAFYDGFNGTSQKTIGQQAGGGLMMSLNETGIQTASTTATGYTGTEISATSAGGVSGQYASQDYQADWYRQMLNLLACDPNVQFVNVFHLIDEPALEGWQSGLYFADESAKKSAQIVQSFLQTGGRCVGSMHPWTPVGLTTVQAGTTPATPAAKPKVAPKVVAKGAPKAKPSLKAKTPTKAKTPKTPKAPKTPSGKGKAVFTKSPLMR
jgi:hypothetical protein